MDCKVAAVTASAMAFEVTPFCEAVMLLDPTFMPVASPAAFRVATAGLDEDQAAVFVRFCVVPSLNVPVAVN
jgi:hypothetical protein